MSIIRIGVIERVTGSLASGITIANDTITNAMVNSAAGIVDTKLATISTSGKISNSATTATSANTLSAIVARDGAGAFSAGTITANLTGNASGTAATFTGSLSGDVTSTGMATTITALPFSKLASLTSANILVGNGSDIATSVSVSGHATLSNTGAVSVVAVANDTITNIMVNSTAAIAGTKVSPDFGSQAVTSIGAFSGKAGGSAAAILKFSGSLYRPTPATLGNTGTNETDVWSYSMPANVLHTNGDCIVVESAGGLAGNGSTKTTKFYLGDTSFTAFAVTTASAGWHCRATYKRISATTVRINATIQVGTSVLAIIDATAVPTDEFTAAQTVKITQQGTTGDFDLNAKFISVDYFPAA